MGTDDRLSCWWKIEQVAIKQSWTDSEQIFMLNDWKYYRVCEQIVEFNVVLSVNIKVFIRSYMEVNMKASWTQSIYICNYKQNICFWLCSLFCLVIVLFIILSAVIFFFSSNPILSFPRINPPTPIPLYHSSHSSSPFSFPLLLLHQGYIPALQALHRALLNSSTKEHTYLSIISMNITLNANEFIIQLFKFTWIFYQPLRCATFVTFILYVTRPAPALL